MQSPDQAGIVLLDFLRRRVHGETQARDDLDYAAARMSQAVFELATGPGDVKARLRFAFLEHVALASMAIKRVPAEYLPRELADMFESICDRMSRRAKYRKPLPQEWVKGLGTVWATLFGMHATTASKIAIDIVRAHEYLEHVLRRLDRRT